MKYILFATLAVVCALSGTQRAHAQLQMKYYCPPCNSTCDRLSYDEPGTCPHCGMELIRQTASDREIAMKSSGKIKIAFYLQNYVEVLDFAGPMEVFSHAGFEVFTVSKTKEPIKSQGVLTVVPDYDITNAPRADVLAFFGGGNAARAAQDPELIGWVRKQSQTADYLFSVCTGAFILGRAGLLDGLTATTFRSAISGLQDMVPKVKVLSDVRFVDNGRVITTAGISAGIDGALHLVARLKGQSEADRVAKTMEYDKWVPGEGLIVEHN